MKVLFVVVLTLILAQALAQQEASSAYLDCFKSVLDEAEKSDRADLQAWAALVYYTDERYNTQKLECSEVAVNSEIMKINTIQLYSSLHKSYFVSDQPSIIERLRIRTCLIDLNRELQVQTITLLNDLILLNPEMGAKTEAIPLCVLHSFGRDF